MKPVRTIHTEGPNGMTHVLPGGTEENNLPSYNNTDSFNNNVICSVWEPTDEERRQIAAGENIRLEVWGTRTPPVSICVTDEEVVRQPIDGVVEP